VHASDVRRIEVRALHCPDDAMDGAGSKLITELAQLVGDLLQEGVATVWRDRPGSPSARRPIRYL
jgi:hypothetical protein